MEKLKKTNGITLIALIVTIIVLLILASVSISMLTGDNGILVQAKKAEEETERANVIEQAQVDILSKQTEKGVEDLTTGELKEILNKYFEEVPEEIPEDLSTLQLK